MTIQSCEIDYDGKQETIEYEDDLKFGELEAILNQCLDLSDVTKPKVNLKNYRIELLTKVITKAPFKINDVATIELMDRNIVQKILKEVLIYHPLADYIEDWMETFQPTGKI